MLKVKSQASLIAGLISGFYIIFSFYWMSRNAIVATGIGCFISLLLFSRFFHVWQRTRKPMPQVPMMILSLGGLGVGIFLLLRIV
ncbi:MAG: TMEM14 family protein [Verrucomicrobiia bacterium]